MAKARNCIRKEENDPKYCNQWPWSKHF